VHVSPQCIRGEGEVFTFRQDFRGESVEEEETLLLPDGVKHPSELACYGTDRSCDKSCVFLTIMPNFSGQQKSMVKRLYITLWLKGCILLIPTQTNVQRV